MTRSLAWLLGATLSMSCSSSSSNEAPGGGGAAGSGGSTAGGAAGSGGSTAGGAAGSGGSTAGGAAGSGGSTAGGAAGNGGSATGGSSGADAGGADGGGCGGAPVTGEGCSALTLGGTKYQVCTSGNPVTWPNARASCKAKCMDLATVGDQTVNNQIAAAQGNTHKWIGLRYQSAQSSFVWTDGKPLGSFKPWAPGEPGASPDDNTCVYLNVAKIWHAMPCGSTSPIPVKSWACEE
jgi:hypothetical protein